MSNPSPRPDLLIGNSFPWSLVERAVSASPMPVSALQERVAAAGRVHSFWGHLSTLAAASIVAGVDLTPATARPALILNADLLPTLDEVVFREVWLISPRYREGFRLADGNTAAPEDVVRWQILCVSWES